MFLFLEFSKVLRHLFSLSPAFIYLYSERGKPIWRIWEPARQLLLSPPGFSNLDVAVWYIQIQKSHKIISEILPKLWVVSDNQKCIEHLPIYLLLWAQVQFLCSSRVFSALTMNQAQPGWNSCSKGDRPPALQIHLAFSSPFLLKLSV